MIKPRKTEENLDKTSITAEENVLEIVAVIRPKENVSGKIMQRIVAFISFTCQGQHSERFFLARKRRFLAACFDASILEAAGVLGVTFLKLEDCIDPC